ncbi:hypothetical protein IFM89_022601 [Coptis chinensis]|uniref:Protein cereblon n=1 Tax=Coptis chinensis TaxID=261450 RepID=A0A835IE87_9MAGN|nr:hypothetical protein IFM89_022601 [Coptis chinensis]
MEEEGEERLMETERLQIEQIRELEMEELEVEEVDFTHHQLSSEDDDDIPNDRRDDGVAGGPSTDFTFDTCLTSLHTYLGEVDETHHRVAFLEGGAILTLPMFYLEGVVLFPEATLPLRVIHPKCKAAVERALNQTEAPYTLGVVRVHKRPDETEPSFGTVGTTAEIRQYKRLEDGSVNVVTRGQQRFRLRRKWLDVEGAPCAEVQIIQEDLPVRTPRDAFGQLASVSNSWLRSLSHPVPSIRSRAHHDVYRNDTDSDSMSEASYGSDLSSAEIRLPETGIDSDQMTNSDDEQASESSYKLGRCHLDRAEGSFQHNIDEKHTGTDSASVGTTMQSILGRHASKGERQNGWFSSGTGHRAPKAFLPHWVYRMFDSYCLAQRAADMWKQIIGSPSMDDLVKKPDLLSFYIASKIPVSVPTRQEILEIDGVSYRLRREIDLLECFDRVRCKTCQTVTAKRSDMLVMSTDGPLGAYANPQGYVHEIMTLYKANGLALIGRPVEDYSWFPGYAWTIAICATCESQLGWLFTAINKKLKPRYFWGIRSSQVADV